MEWVPEGFKPTPPKRFKFNTEDMDPQNFDDHLPGPRGHRKPVGRHLVEEPVSELTPSTCEFNKSDDPKCSSVTLEPDKGGVECKDPSTVSNRSSLSSTNSQSWKPMSKPVFESTPATSESSRFDDSKDSSASLEPVSGKAGEEEDDDDASTVSDLSCLSDMSGRNWKTVSKPILESTPTTSESSVFCDPKYSSASQEHDKGKEDLDGASTVSNFSSLSDVNSQNWKPMSKPIFESTPATSASRRFDDSKDSSASLEPESGKAEDDEDDDDDDDDASTVSDLSCLSDMSGQNWKPTSSKLNENVFAALTWIRQQQDRGVDPRVVFSQITGEHTEISEFIPDMTLWRMIISFLTENPKRARLPQVSTIEDAVELIKKSSKIIVLTGAGVSVSCGIPDFRSKDGLYARLAVDFPDLFDPQAMFSIDYFRKNPRPFFKFAKEMYPGQFKPSPSHRFIKAIEKHKKLLRNYTQNIDTLEKVAGIENVIECHGSFATASCTVCGHKVSCDDIKPAILEQRIPFCEVCAANPDSTLSEDASECEKGVMKPDIVFFGEGLPEAFHKAMEKDSDECDLLIVMGSSLKVKPVALIPNSIPSSVPQILINRERLPYMNFDVELLGDSDSVVDQLCRMLGEDWCEVCWRETPLSNVTSQLPPISNYGFLFGSDDEEEDSTPIKCQKIGKRHIPGDESTRHVSLDSSRDSGIGESSNGSTEGSSPHPSGPVVNENTFYCLGKRKYVFPGAEIPGLPSFFSPA